MQRRRCAHGAAVRVQDRRPPRVGELLRVLAACRDGCSRARCSSTRSPASRRRAAYTVIAQVLESTLAQRRTAHGVAGPSSRDAHVGGRVTGEAGRARKRDVEPLCESLIPKGAATSLPELGQAEPSHRVGRKAGRAPALRRRRFEHHHVGRRKVAFRRRTALRAHSRRVVAWYESAAWAPVASERCRSRARHGPETVIGAPPSPRCAQ
jgi:hypothetical protein